MKTITKIIYLASAALALACFTVSPAVQAVTPAPDGGYPGGNTAEGQAALLSLTTGGFNTAVGFLSLRSDTINSFNTAFGAGALLANTEDQNTAVGAGALLSNTIGPENTAVGAFALFSNTGVGLNTAVGALALTANTAGANTAVGDRALVNNTTGNFNSALGSLAGMNVTTANNVICIGAEVAGANVSDTCFIGNIRGMTTVNNNAIPVLIDSAGQLGTQSSSRRFKKEIKPMGKASEAILALRPVTFHYKSDKTNRPEFGLIAEEVAEINPDLVVRDEKGDIYTVRYDTVNAMLLNEFLKEHQAFLDQKCKVEKEERKMQTQEATIVELKFTVAQQEKQIETLTAGLRKVSAEIEMSKTAPKVVFNNR